MLIIAYPSELSTDNKTKTDIEFEYWIAPEGGFKEEPISVYVIIAAVIGSICALLTICLVCFLIR